MRIQDRVFPRSNANLRKRPSLSEPFWRARRIPGDYFMAKPLKLATAALALCALSASPGLAEIKLAKGDARKIAEEAMIYGLPLIMNYGVYYESFIDKTSSQYKAPFNQLYNTARVYTPADTAVVTPNSDTPYSFIGMDLRAEPMVICTPQIEKARYFSLQLIDMYTFNYGYVGSRATGNDAQCSMVTGPRWRGKKPAGVKSVFRSETDFSLGLIRTQLFNASDIENVKKIQAGYRAVPLSTFLNKPAPEAPAEISWPKIDKQLAEKDPFAYLNFLLAFAPPIGPAAVEKPLRARFARLGIEAGKPFSVAQLSEDQKSEVAAGLMSGMEAIKKAVAGVGKQQNGWRVATDGFGDRKMLAGNYTLRAAAAMAGIYGNDAVEALYPMLVADSDGERPDASTRSYTLTFPAGQLPPANAFWSVTMYDEKTQLLVKNPIDRYLINSPMLPDLKKNDDGSITLLIQNKSPGKDKESNWLPAPDGKIYVVMRVYWPKATALKGTWKPPVVKRVKIEG
jgi:hypothetical protein